MSDNGHHSHVTPGHGVDLQTIIDVQRDKLALLDDQATVHLARLRQAEQQLQSLAGMLSQIRAENLILRRRLNLDATEPVELTDAEVEQIGEGAQIETQP